MLSDAELLLGLSRHLAAYEVSPSHAALDSLQFAGQVYELAWRLRNSQVSSVKRIEAIAIEARIGTRQLHREVLPTMEQLDWIESRRDAERLLVSIEALIPPNEVLIADATRLLDILLVSAVQRAALELIRSTSRQPLPVEEALQGVAQWGEEAAIEALAHLEAVKLVRRVEQEVDRPVVFNPNIWTNDEQAARAALRAQDAHAGSEVAALLEEIIFSPGMPEKHVTSTEQRWIDFAVSQGLIERSIVQTSDGSEQGFLFSPHLKRDAFGTALTDPSGHVRQLVGSMIYASTFASWRLNSPGGFLYTLIRDGEAGNVSNIGTDYPMLETAGTIQVVPGRSSSTFKMVLLQSDIAESALSIIDSRGPTNRGEAGSLQNLGDQRRYSHVERERAKMAAAAGTGDREADRLIAACGTSPREVGSVSTDELPIGEIGAPAPEHSAASVPAEQRDGEHLVDTVSQSPPETNTTARADDPPPRASNVNRLASPTPERSRARGRAGGKGQGAVQTVDPGADLERRVGRTEFNDGALVRLRVPIRIDADSGRDVLTDIDVLAIDVDGRLRISRSVLECKSGKGQSGEPDRLLWLAGLQRFLGFERAVLVRQSVSRRGRGLARALGLRTLDVPTLATREAAHAWLPERFGHVEGAECQYAEQRTDTQLKGLGHIPPDLVAFLRFEALRSEPHRILRAVAALGRAASVGGVLPNPARLVLAGHAQIALVAAALGDASRLDEMSATDVLERTNRALVTGDPDDEHVLAILGRADEVIAYSLDRVHTAYQEVGAKRQNVDFPSLKAAVASPPAWVPRYVDLVVKLRANPSVARQMLQTAELAFFEALVGGSAHRVPAFDHLFTQDHRYMLNLANRLLADVAGTAVAEALSPALDLDFTRGHKAPTDHDVAPEGG